MPTGLIWLIYLLPTLAFVINALVVRSLAKPAARISGYINIAAIGGSLLLSLWLLFAVMAAPEHQIEVSEFTWFSFGTVTINIGLMVDSLTAVMLIVVTVVSLMVQIYSQGYMQGDPGYHRYYAWLALFTASMLGMVLSSSILVAYIFWEMMGACSYLLIGFWFHRPSAAKAAKKAFVVTRIGDVGFLLGILVLYAATGTFDIPELHHLAIAGAIAGSTLTWAMLGIFAGAVGKSAQFPLHVWLPDAMEGPTPVSALIHAATMVAAGVFLVARTFPLFVNSLTAVTTVAVIGAFTAIFAATIGLVMNDMKRVVAYSTISQLGFMMLGLGAAGIGVYHEIAHHAFKSEEAILVAAKAATAIGIFHLFNHAFFKALLFLGSGSVNHATHTFDMREMGGLRKHMPWTYITFLLGSLSLAGIWPLAGFWSKDEILAVAWHNQKFLFFLVIIAVFMTAFYIFRVIFLVFEGEYRGNVHAKEGHAPAPVTPAPQTHAAHDAHGHDPHKADAHATAQHEEHSVHLHESSAVMVGPMVVLAILAVFSGFWNVNRGFDVFMGEGETKNFFVGLFEGFTHPLPWIALLVAAGGIFTAYAIYKAKWISAEKMGETFKPIYVLLSKKYYIDELYQNVIVETIFYRGIFVALQWIDTNIVDGVVNAIGYGVKSFFNKYVRDGLFRVFDYFDGTKIPEKNQVLRKHVWQVDGVVDGVGNSVISGGRVGRRIHTGQLQFYGLILGLGIIALILVLYITG